jgi:cobalt-zinc-cadmium efflux system membrane fusion protein
VRATIANPDGALKPQMFANFTIRHQESLPANGPAVLSVPSQSVIREGDRPACGSRSAPTVSAVSM